MNEGTFRKVAANKFTARGFAARGFATKGLAIVRGLVIGGLRGRAGGHLAMVLFALLIAGSFSLGKLAVPHIAPAPLNAMRFVIACIVMGGIVFGIRKQPLALPSSGWRFAIFGGLMATYFVTMFMALELTSPVSTSAVFTLSPLLTAIAGYFLLRQRVSPAAGASLFLAAAGSIWVIFKGDIAAILSFGVGTGELIFLLGCIAYAFYAPLFARWRGPEPLLVQTFWTLLATTMWLLLISGKDFFKIDWLSLPPVAIGGILYLALFTTAMTNFLLQFATTRIPSAKVMAYVYLTPVFVILLEGLWGRGWPAPGIWGGALAIVGGLVVLYFSADDRGNRAKAPGRSCNAGSASHDDDG